MEQTDRTKRVGGVGNKERSTKKYTVYTYMITHGHRQKCGEGLGGARAGWRRPKRTSVIINNKKYRFSLYNKEFICNLTVTPS